MSKPQGYVDSEYLQVAAKLVQQAKACSYSHMVVQAGHRVLDVGCGPGIDTVALGRLVESTGQVIGVDWDGEMVANAGKRAKEAGVDAWVKHSRADAAALPFEAGTFDSCRSERLFQHLVDPDRVLAEMVRVTKVGGWVVLVDTDHGAMSIDAAAVDVERRLVRVLAERLIRDGYSGRRLYGRVKRAGLTDVRVELLPMYVTDYGFARRVAQLDKVGREAVVAGIVTEEELREWEREIEAADAEGAFFALSCTVIVAGRRR